MSNFIVPLSNLPTVSSIDKATGAGKAAGAGQLEGLPFADVLSNAMQGISETQQNSQSSMVGLATGSTDDLHSGAIDALKYNTAVSFASGVTSSVVRAYNELMRMQI